MGNTIRREPVNFAIPKSPDYKFLNITNFRGLDISSNPFELATNTASDCLNVYVDETNTLTTRPRLQKKYQTGIAEFIKGISDNAVLIGVYPVSFGYLFNVKVDTLAYMYLLSVEHNEIYKITSANDLEIPDTKCMVFEQNDKIFLLANGCYLYVDIPEDMTSEDIHIRQVEGYIPTTHVVALDGSKKNVDGFNLLNDKYKIQYDWAIDVPIKNLPENNIHEGFVETDGGFYGDGSDWYFKRDDNDVYWMWYKKDKESDYEPTINLTDYGFNYLKKVEWSVNKKAFVGIDAISATERKYFYGYFYDNSWKAITLTETSVESGSQTDCAISDDTYGFAYKTKHNLSSCTKIDIDPDENTYEKYEFTDGKFGYDFHYQNGILLGYSAGGGISVVNTENEIITKTDLKVSTMHKSGVPFGMLDSETLYVIDMFQGFNTISLREGVEETRQVTNFDFGVFQTFPEYPYSAWYVDNNKIKLIPVVRNINKSHVNTGMDFCVDYNWMYNEYLERYVFRNGNYFYSKVHKSGSKKELSYKRIDAKSFVSSTHEIVDNDDWTEHRQKLLNSTLMTRFDNNYWFASGNNYYRSRNNDPTYFPITEYDSLGDTKEHITGFNLANDTTLLVYKPNKIYLIQPFFSEATGDIEYSKTESKNTVGNTAVGAPIVTTLTETPLQINYDGIYGLSQLANVSAVERIADLISEPINHKWLDIPTEVIDNAQTLNRLYWTYVILPRETNTQIFLLDNRTNSWYYWELPIKVKTSFVIDNRAEFVDEEGTIYYLTSEDIRNKNFLPTLVTEYYDEGKILIPWYWQSQIMHLGTMNYTKRLVNTTFVLTDTDTQDGFGLKYSFKVFRKLASSTPEKEISNDFNLVRSTTKKTNISKFGFVQLKISNIPAVNTSTDPEVAYRNNKLRLVGLGLKYVLLEGLIR